VAPAAERSPTDQLLADAPSEQLLDGSPHALDPRVRFVWAAGACGTVLLLGGAVIVLLGIIGAPSWSIASAVVATLLSLSAAVIWTQLAVARWRWSAWPEALELRHGVLVVRESLVPYHRIQQIDVVRDPLERLLGLSTLALRTAAATTDAKLPGIPAESAESLRRALLGRAHVDDAV
jgi:membrane protein YdbS with pleckstrin-like domain